MKNAPTEEFYWAVSPIKPVSTHGDWSVTEKKRRPEVTVDSTPEMIRPTKAGISQSSPLANGTSQETDFRNSTGNNWATKRRYVDIRPIIEGREAQFGFASDESIKSQYELPPDLNVDSNVSRICPEQTDEEEEFFGQVVRECTHFGSDSDREPDSPPPKPRKRRQKRNIEDHLRTVKRRKLFRDLIVCGTRHPTAPKAYQEDMLKTLNDHLPVLCKDLYPNGFKFPKTYKTTFLNAEFELPRIRTIVVKRGVDGQVIVMPPSEVAKNLEAGETRLFDFTFCRVSFLEL